MSQIVQRKKSTDNKQQMKVTKVTAPSDHKSSSTANKKKATLPAQGNTLNIVKTTNNDVQVKEQDEELSIRETDLVSASDKDERLSQVKIAKDPALGGTLNQTQLTNLAGMQSPAFDLSNADKFVALTGN